MEISSSLSIESFSYSWLVNIKSSDQSLDNSLRASLDASADEASFIEMDPKMPPSKRFFVRRVSQDFKFDFPSSPSNNLGFVHADELFSNGYLVPLFLDDHDHSYYPYPSNDDSNSTDQTTLTSSSDHSTTTTTTTTSDNRRQRRILSKRILQKYLSFLRPLYRRIRGQVNNSSSKNNHNNKLKSCSEKRVVGKGKSRVYSSELAASPPRISVAYSAPDHECLWRKSCDSDTSIYEAVLHCKRSIGN